MKTLRAGSALLLFLCGLAASAQAPSYRLDNPFPRQSFQRPVDLQWAEDGGSRLFVVEQRGRILSIDEDRPEAPSLVFLDIRDRVETRGKEQGLLGLAFHPDFRHNGFFFVDYTAASPPRTVISRFSLLDGDPVRADPRSEKVILEIPQPYSNHNGGQLAFGPDGLLYIAMGDGGGSGDPQGRAQDRRSLLGKILRIDVDRAEDGRAYALPRDNPFYASKEGFRGEIFALGLRNPWRFSFEPGTGLLWAADVGQDRTEEIDIVKKGGNYGWNLMEGTSPYKAGPGPLPGGLEAPIFEYDHSVGSSITGGYFYTKGPLAELVGRYIYADFVTGKIWALRYEGARVRANDLLLVAATGISSFGKDGRGRLFILGFDGLIHELAR